MQLIRRTGLLLVSCNVRVIAQALNSPLWPAPGSADTELGVLMEPEVGHGEAEVYTGVQA